MQVTQALNFKTSMGKLRIRLEMLTTMNSIRICMLMLKLWHFDQRAFPITGFAGRLRSDAVAIHPMFGLGSGFKAFASVAAKGDRDIEACRAALQKFLKGTAFDRGQLPGRNGGIPCYMRYFNIVE